MAVVREQFMVGINYAAEMYWEKKRLAFDERLYDEKNAKSTKVAVSECRVFRKESKGYEDKVTMMKDEFGRLVRDADGAIELDWTTVRSAREFVVVDFNKCKQKMKIKEVLLNGFTMKYADGTEKLFKRVSRSAAKSRTKKALFTCKDVHQVRARCSYGAQFEEMEVISKMEARFGLIESSSIEIKQVPTIDVLPDYEITRYHDVEVYDPETQELNLLENREETYNPQDGQGTILPAYAATVAHELALISREDRNYLQRRLKAEPDPRVLVKTDEKFAKIWTRVPSALLVRYGFAKGLLVVYPHNIEALDAFGNDRRTTGKIMKFWQETEHKYNFDADIMFTDSMWKANFNKDYLTGVPVVNEEGEEELDFARLEVVLWSKKPTGMINMGYQYWQALNPEIADPYAFAKVKINEMKDTIFVDADEAKAFLGNIDRACDSDEYEQSMTKAGGKIQKVLEMLNENPAMIHETYIQKALREMRERYVKDMGFGRVPIEGANPFIITAPELQFGHESELEAGESYYNGEFEQYAAFRSPLIHRSEAVVITAVDVPAYHGLYANLLVLNPFDDTLPRMGGADTDGDRVAIVKDETIVSAVYTDLPMLYDAGADADKQVVSDRAIYEFDYATIDSDAPTIGEVTNMATSWKDIAQNPEIMDEMGVDEDMIDYIVKILRFMQGWAIDYAKTGYFPPVPAIVNIITSPDWCAWSKTLFESGNDDAEPFESDSRMGVLYRAIKLYLESHHYRTAEKNNASRDFTFEFASAADFELMEEIRPQVAALESAYRQELDVMRDKEMDDDQVRDYLNVVVDKYQRAVLSLDADIATIATACYQHAYYDNGTKGKSISFPWVVAYEGLLMNVAESEGDKTKLRSAFFKGHIDDVPATLKFYKCESKGEDYSVRCRVPNGTYETFRKNGNLYIKTKGRVNKRLKKAEKARPTDVTLAVHMVGFNANGFTAKEVISALKATDGVIRIVKQVDSDNGELRAAVMIGDQRMGSIGKKHKSLLAGYLPCEVKVTNVDTFEPFYHNAAGKFKETAFFGLDATFITMIEDEPIVTKSAEPSAPSGYMSYDQAYDMPAAPPVVEEEIHENFNTPVLPTLQPEVMAKLTLDAEYWNTDIDPVARGIVGMTIKQTGAIVANQECAEVILTNSRGAKKTVTIQSVPGKRFALLEGKLPEDIEHYVLQIVHHELYRMYMVRREMNKAN